MSDRLLLRTGKNTYAPACDYLKDELGFEVIDLIDDKAKSIKSKKEHIKEGFRGIKAISANKKRIKKADTLISIGNFNSMWLLVLNKLHIIRPKTILWWAFFFHSKKAQKLLKVLVKLTGAENVRFVVFSQCEIELYHKALGVKKDRFLYLPYGNWTDSAEDDSKKVQTKDFYFSGGYSNRDYKALIDAWSGRQRIEKLVIIGSRNNKELPEYVNKFNNVSILLDVPSQTFDDYLVNAKACILPFKDNTGASGQSVMLRCMRLGKVVIAKRTDIIEEYSDDSVIMVDNYDEDLSKAMELASDPDYCRKMLDRQKALYEQKFSYAAITARLKEIVETVESR
jgi:glycosyltransferase involved in cell wall biosynthesis